MAEWSIAAVLKTVKPKGFGGSNPSVSARAAKSRLHNEKTLPVGSKERCRSGRSGRSRKPLNALRSKGSNPFLSAKFRQVFENQAFAKVSKTCRVKIGSVIQFLLTVFRKKNGKE